MSAAVAMANLDLFEREGLNERRPRARGRVPHARWRSCTDLPIVGDVRGDGLLLRHRAGQGQGDQGDLRRRRGRAAAARLPVQGAVRGRAVLPRRRPGRPGHPARAAADLRPGRVRRDGAHPAQRPHGGLGPAVTSGPKAVLPGTDRAYRGLSLWHETAGEDWTPRPSLPGSTDADVVVVGAGFTGLWTAYYLLGSDPSLRVVVLEAEVAGFGASGRNGGWCSALFPTSEQTAAPPARRRPGPRPAPRDAGRRGRGRPGLRGRGHRRALREGRVRRRGPHPRPAAPGRAGGGGRPRPRHRPGRPRPARPERGTRADRRQLPAGRHRHPALRPGAPRPPGARPGPRRRAARRRRARAHAGHRAAGRVRRHPARHRPAPATCSGRRRASRRGCPAPGAPWPRSTR